MSNFSFDFYGQTEIPNFSLANPDGTILYNLGTIYDRNFEMRYNGLSTLTFTAPSIVDGVATDYYNSIEYRRLIYVDGIANFMITDVEIKDDGAKKIKMVTCKSLEVILSYKKLNLFSGTYTFNNTLSGSGVTTSNLMSTLVSGSYIPGWSIGTIDSSLNDITRTFDISDKSLYDFLVNDVSQSYQCVFVFDSINKIISAYSLSNAATQTDIFISFDNLMKSLTVSESTEEFATALNVLGGDGISINYVNPLGSNTIYDFDYYKTTSWMNQGLIDALDAWENKVNINQPIYASYLTGARNSNANLVSLNTQLTTLEGELAALNSVKDARVQQGLDITEVSGSIVVVNNDITIVSASIVSEQGILDGINAQLTVINNDVSFYNSSNFSAAQLSQLDNFIVVNTYTNTNYVKTSLFTEVDVQNVSQELYDQARVVLDKLSVPRYTFEIDSANFLFIQDFEPFINQLELGCTITVELSQGVYTYPVLLGYDFSYDDPSVFEMILSNRLRLDTDEFQYGDLYNSTVDSSNTTNLNSQKWNSVSDAYSEAVEQGGGFVASISPQSSPNNIALFYNSNGKTIVDGQAMYVAPIEYSGSLVSDGTNFTYNYNTGIYGIVGRTLFFTMDFSISGSSGTGVNPIYITLPVYNKTLTNLNSPFKIVYDNVNLGAGYSSVVGLLPSSSGSIALYKEGNNVPLSPLIPNDIGSSTKLYISGLYAVN